MKSFYYLIILVVTSTLLSGCLPNESGSTIDPAAAAMDKLNVPKGFNFNTSKEITFKIGAYDNMNNPISGVIMSVYSYPENVLLFKGITLKNGVFSLNQKIPTYVTKISVKPDYIGLPSETIVTLSGTTSEVNFGGNNPTASESVEQPLKAARLEGTTAQTYPLITYLGSWNSDGLPAYLEKDRDPISSQFLEYINASLPESKSVPVAHPDFLNNNNRNFLYITEAADVWVTFVHEGAGWKNTLGYYTFNPLNPPKTTADISKMTVVFPNVSYKGSGGALVSGDKVKIGQFPAGTGIGFVLLADSYTSNSKVGTGNYAHFSHDVLNVESKESLRRHLIVLNEPSTKRMVLAFEDIQRESSSCDQDFNDAIFFATSNPIKAIDTNNVPIVDSPKDTDGDGVGDSRDEYPTDPARAINNYIPGSNTYSTLAYEDLWPLQGDYDMNDLVINYQFQEVLNAQNQVVDLKGKFYIKAIGASYINGWGFQLPIDPSLVKSVSGQSLTQGMITNSSNGTEAGQKYATIIAFDNAFKQMKSSGGFINTSKGASVIAPNDTLRLTISFTTPISKTTLGVAPYNPFLFSANDRGKEVHLPNMAPTSKANMSLFGTGQDASVPSSGIYYKNAKLLPWAIDLPSDFKYPLETVPIIDAYNEFGLWAESGGTLYPDWYVISKAYFDPIKVF
ncbi:MULTISPECIES: LruC domain-containing protein [unclassified Arcicella]|uniref:LruC domain-containing protein n=1 Tax=unclassified Arcicella TaxID=2644986 RepID=UPI002856E644|nr:MULTISPECIES: LruC domain-containing protein [unclassified Arcicella]MDR6560583.1 LruC domain-containing protein [Arcicella sp. BE51]MDR6814666.1 LruC domain-containing protein [Arcicella sp. BE140]MDR6826112.1 LruC domain-containing protein [Arcicella sp. BE139]